MNREDVSPDNIRAALARHIAAAKYRTPFGVLLKDDMKGLYRRTASDCGCTVAEVKDAQNG